jgi:hypothetical protein
MKTFERDWVPAWPSSGINRDYQNTGTIGAEDGDALIRLKG